MHCHSCLPRLISFRLQNKLQLAARDLNCLEHYRRENSTTRTWFWGTCQPWTTKRISWKEVQRWREENKARSERLGSVLTKSGNRLKQAFYTKLMQSRLSQGSIDVHNMNFKLKSQRDWGLVRDGPRWEYVVMKPSKPQRIKQNTKIYQYD